MSALVRIWDDLVDRTGYVFVGDRLPGAQTEQDVVLDIPGYRQLQTFTCGFVAGLMVLHTFKPKASIGRFYNRVKPDPENGTGSTKLIKALRDGGIGVGVRKSLRFADVAKSIDAGHPIIVPVKTGKADDHWVVLYGYGPSPKRIFLAGNGIPYLSRKVIPWAKFKRLWSPPGEGLVCWGK